MSLQQRFEEHAQLVRSFTKKPSDEEMKEIYGLYKQATIGDNNTSQPWSVQIESRAKWDAWESKKGLDKDTAMEQYIEIVNNIKSKYA